MIGALLQGWNIVPEIIIALMLAGWLYMRGTQALWQRAGLGRGLQFWRALAFVGGLIALAIALVSPLDMLAARLFSAHMLQHLVLILVAAPLLVLGKPLLSWLWALPSQARHAIRRGWVGVARLRPIWRAISSLPVAWVLHTTILWCWHAPVLYQAALRSVPIHALEHSCFLGSALLFWWAIWFPPGGARRYGLSLLAVTTMGMQNSLLGALITFSPRPWYALYASKSAGAGLTPLDDQQIAGLIMWIPASIIYLAAAAGLFTLWLRAIERTMCRRDAARSAIAAASLANES